MHCTLYPANSQHTMLFIILFITNTDPGDIPPSVTERRESHESHLTDHSESAQSQANSPVRRNSKTVTWQPVMAASEEEDKLPPTPLSASPLPGNGSYTYRTYCKNGFSKMIYQRTLNSMQSGFLVEFITCMGAI